MSENRKGAGLKRLRSNQKDKKPTFKCDNCKCMRYAPCKCMKKAQ